MANSTSYVNNNKIRRLVEQLAVAGYDRKNIVIYGIGAVAKSIASQLTEANIVGLMDKDPGNIGRCIYGYEVLSTEVAISKADAIVIAASEVYWDTIFRRISFMKSDYGKQIFFTNGDIADFVLAERETQMHPYWDTTHDVILSEIEHHEVISFDVFDTLICRKISRPEDIYSIVEERANMDVLLEENFFQIRMEAVDLFQKSGDPVFSIHELYAFMTAHFGIAKERAERLKQLEIDVEIEFSEPRNEVIALYHLANRLNKRVYLISDYHMPSDILKRIFFKSGIALPTGLLVSCEVKKSKLSGALWEYYRNLIGNGKALHIGDNDIADISNPVLHGIQPCKIMSCNDMLFASSLRQIGILVRGLQDSKIVGLIQHHLFNSPFSLGANKGYPEIVTLKTFGYVFLGPLIYNYFSWLIPELASGVYNKVLFLAREGYLLKRIYDKLTDSLGLTGHPEGVYFRTSRRMASVASIMSEDDIFATLNDSFSGTAREFLENRFGIDGTNEDSSEILVQTDSKIVFLVRKYSDIILRNAAVERSNYLNYMNRSGVITSRSMAVADIGIKGSIQYYLGKIIESELVGYYMTALTGPDNPYCLGKNIKALYPEPLFDKRKSSNVFKYHLMLESTLVAPEGMYIRANEDGTFVHGPHFYNQLHFEYKAEIHAGIEAFVFDMLASNGYRLGKPASPDLVDELFGLPMSGTCLISDEIKNSFHIDELFGVVNEKKIWE
ncbi:hydrolase (HAD superfamily)-like protein [Pelobacter propionicus DSM 2379]|uniref:Hydrolase (HAD superfamily)-like protein n=1 Tax=Pelobacter propionicus (strain DSM 2379 / NBRC 103807 / OttBd1) TaxID=338966 RepID=A1AUB2_PELPD|nr:hydrolase (HAD superfamily)-like protein [Pelobacter propionicus DSM 2379]